MLMTQHALSAPADAPADAKPAALQRRAGAALAAGASSLLRALKEYGEHASAAAAWQEALVELLQGSLQRLLVALVQLFLTTCGIDLQVQFYILGSATCSI